ncbi:hypothetical protein G3G77_002000 [Salmonella enterica]|nr:hypothetical protein [Salmonella enterica]EEH5466214.1 hypothetical protein [Salmonella enterica]EEH7553415.1 hypothetical protein [Salmonella enterica]EEO5637641.1 hypothetical protein [Salmonella enterica]EEQ0200562.1 hypothetical protein [Salmonella enterica]
MKYIILRLDGKIPREVPVIFPDLLVHADVAEAMTAMIKEDSSNTNITNVRVVSAGFCNTAVECFGKSESLDIASRDIDDTVINTWDYTFGLLLGE